MRCTCPVTSTPASACSTSRRSRSTPPRAPRSRYMGRQMVFPYNTWNYAHNRNYLSYVQEQLGLPTEAIRGARELLAVPLDPKLNVATRMSPHWQGVSALSRALVKFERWDEILKDGLDSVGRFAPRQARPPLRRGHGAPRQERSSRRRTKAVDDHAALKAEIDKDSELHAQAPVRGAGPRAARLAGAAQGRGDRRPDAADAGARRRSSSSARTTTIRRSIRR